MANIKEQKDRISNKIRGIKQDKTELVALLEKHSNKLPKADQDKTQEIKARNYKIEQEGKPK